MNKNAKKIAKENSEINIDIDAYKKHLFEKVNRLLNKIKQIKSYQKEINYYITNKDKCKEKINKAIQEIKSISNEYNNKKLNEVNDDDGNNNNNIGDLKDYFTRMNTIEKNTEKICHVGKTIEEWEDINSKLEIALKTVENKIYSIINEAMNDTSYKPNNNTNNTGNNSNNFSHIYENNKQNEEEENIEKIEEEEENAQNEQNVQNNKSEDNIPVINNEEEKKGYENLQNKEEKTPEIIQESRENKIDNQIKEGMGQGQENVEGNNGGDEEYEEIEEEVEEEVEEGEDK